MNHVVCPICSSRNIGDVFQHEAVPVYNLQILRARVDAMDVAKGTVDFKFCHDCQFCFNASYDEKIIDYKVEYEASRGNSPVFNKFIDKVAEDITEHFQLTGSDLVAEVGSGDGQLLRLLSDKVKSNCFGFDVSAPGATFYGDRVCFINDYYNSTLLSKEPDVLVLRHILEHQSDVRSFLSSLICEQKYQPKNIYIEVPAFEWIYNNNNFYCFSYEHCSYFTINSLTKLLQYFGYSLKECNYTFGGEYIQCFAEKNNIPKACSLNYSFISETGLYGYVSNLQDKIKEYSTVLMAGNNILWGGSGKGVMTLNVLNVFHNDFSFVVDINSNKHNTFIPRTGQKIINPDTLATISHVDTVFITTRLYKAEIEETLSKMNINANIHCIE